MSKNSESFSNAQSIAIEVAQNLSITTNTPPLMPSKTPRWLLSMLPIVNVKSGIYRINKVDVLSELEIALMGRNKEITPDILQKIPLFDGISDAFLKRLISLATRKKVNEGQIVTKKGDKKCSFYIVLEGRFDVNVTNPHGEYVVVSTLSSGDYFGELSLIEGTPRQSTVYAATNGELIEFDQKAFNTIFQDQQIKKKLKARAEKVHKAIKRISYQHKNESQAPLLAGHSGEPIIPSGFVNYERHPKEIHLSVIQTTIAIHTRLTDIYNVPYDQLEQQLHLTLENIQECEESEIINNEAFGLLNNVHANMCIKTRNGPPTPNDFDELLSLVWKEPSFFLAHPKAIAAFGRECTSRGVPPPTIEMFGSRFITWRGIPLIPSDKMPINYVDGAPTTSILLMRTGEDKRGVVSLNKMSLNEKGLNGTTIKFMGINESSISTYLITKYFSIATLVPDALGKLTGVKLNNYSE